MAKYLRNFKKSSFVRNSVVLTFGTIIAQGIPVLFSPILSRIFPPDQFGLLATLTSITVILSTISTGKYESAILIANRKQDAADIMFIALFLSAFVSLLALIILFFFSDTFLQIIKQPSLAGWIFICPFTSFFIAIYLCYNEWCVRNSYFKNLSFNKITNSSSIVFSSVIVGILKVINGGLIMGDTFGRFVSACFCVWHAVKTDYISFKNVTYTNVRLLTKRYSSFPKFIMPAQLLNVAGGQMPILLIGSYFGSKEVGYFAIVNMVLAVPASVISNTVKDVFRQRANEEYQQKQNCLDIYLKTIKTITAFSILIFGFLFFISLWLFPFVFGAAWTISGQYAQILIPLMALGFIVESVSGMFIIAEKTKHLLFWQALYFILITSSLFIGHHYFNDIRATLVCFALGKGLVYLLSFFMTYNFAKGKNI